MKNNDTTDLPIVRRNPSRFTWGRVEHIHDIGRFTFVEYRGRVYEHGCATGALKAKTSFHIYVDAISTGSSVGSLESAMIYAIATANLRVGNFADHMAHAALKILGVPAESAE